jgi:hypothetical protein
MELLSQLQKFIWNISWSTNERKKQEFLCKISLKLKYFSLVVKIRRFLKRIFAWMLSLNIE